MWINCGFLSYLGGVFVLVLIHSCARDQSSWRSESQLLMCCGCNTIKYVRRAFLDMDFVEALELSLEIAFIVLFSFGVICQIINCVIQYKYLEIYKKVNKSLLEKENNENDDRLQLVIREEEEENDDYYSSVEEF